jgi:hypothetical protein
MVVLNDEKHLTASKKQQQSCSGYCTRCSTVHSLPSASAREKGKELIRQLEERKSIEQDDTDQDPRLSTEPLFGEQRGKMFGVLECLDQNGKKSWLYAFSGQFNGLWVVDGWAPPLFDLSTFEMVHDPVEKRIKALGKEMQRVPAGSDHHLSLISHRRQLSRQLMIDLHDLYRLQNFTGDTATLHQAFIQPGGKPTGTGDCCAPKLLQLAAASELFPLSLAEFFFGRSNRSGTREHGCFYSPCSDKCQPLLGFLLCGIEGRIGAFVN